MTVIYNTPLTNTRLTDVVNAIDAGGGHGVMLIGTVGMASILSSITLAKPCGSVANRVLTFLGLPLVDGAAAATGIAAAAQIKDSNGTIVVSGLSVGLAGSGADAIINDANINVGDIVSLNTATITG